MSPVTAVDRALHVLMASLYRSRVRGLFRVGHTLTMRIVSLLPSATEMVFALGLEQDLVGVTHECDFPEAAQLKPIVSVSALPVASTPAEVDRLVSASLGDGQPIYRLDEVAMRDLNPDLVLSQDLCAVCAVPSGQVNEALEVLGCRAQVMSMDPSSLSDVLDCVIELGRITGTETVAHEVVDRLAARLTRVEQAVAGLRRPRTFALEWSDPPFNGGHWVPEMIERAGGEPVLGNRGTDSSASVGSRSGKPLQRWSSSCPVGTGWRRPPSRQRVFSVGRNSNPLTPSTRWTRTPISRVQAHAS